MIKAILFAAEQCAFGLSEFLVILACVCIVVGVVAATITRKKRGKPPIGCDGCCKNCCGGCASENTKNGSTSDNAKKD